MSDQFWADVVAAHNQVAVHHERRITVERGGKKALVIYELHSDSVVIAVTTGKTETVEPLNEP